MDNTSISQSQTLPCDEDSFEAQLMRYRGEIDAIDKQLYALFEARVDVVQRVGALKSAHNITGSYIRPGREAIMVKELLEKASGAQFPKQALAAIWRIIIGSSTSVESPLNTLCFQGDYEAEKLGATYFGPCVPHKTLHHDALLDTLRADRHAIALLPYDAHVKWWPDLPNNVYVFACLPFVTSHPPTHIACGYVTPEPTHNDITLTYDPDIRQLHEHDGFHPELPHFVGAFSKPIQL